MKLEPKMVLGGRLVIFTRPSRGHRHEIGGLWTHGGVGKGDEVGLGEGGGHTALPIIK